MKNNINRKLFALSNSVRNDSGNHYIRGLRTVYLTSNFEVRLELRVSVGSIALLRVSIYEQLEDLGQIRLGCLARRCNSACRRLTDNPVRVFEQPDDLGQICLCHLARRCNSACRRFTDSPLRLFEQLHDLRQICRSLTRRTNSTYRRLPPQTAPDL